MSAQSNFQTACFRPSTGRMCNDPECRKQIAAYHSVTEERFWYSVTADDPLRVYEKADLEDLNNMTQCAGCEERIGVLEDGTLSLDADNAICNYSVPLLRGIFDQEPTKIEVYAGIYAISGEKDRLLRVTFDGIVKFYDLSDSYP